MEVVAIGWEMEKQLLYEEVIWGEGEDAQHQTNAEHAVWPW
jgi:hypothetical protein